MSIPKFSELFNDVLTVLSDGSQLHRRELQTEVLNRLVLSDANILNGNLEFKCELERRD